MAFVTVATTGCDGCSGDLTTADNQANQGDIDATDDVNDFDADVSDCPDNSIECVDECCPEGQVCSEGSCQDFCEGTLCGPDRDICCDGDELCFGDGCVAPGAECQWTEECEVGEICEPTENRCLSREYLPICEYTVDTDEFEPEVGCTWVSDDLQDHPQRGDIVAAPVVANLTDDNGDGVTDTDDTPNIVFPSFNRSNQGCCNVPSTLRILDGECGDDGQFETIASINAPAINNDSGLALGDLTGNGVPEIVGVTNIGGQPQGTVAFTRTVADGTDWDVLWHNQDYPNFGEHTRGGAITSIADLDGDGEPEVIIGNVVLDGQTGDLVWDGLETSNGDGGIGNNAFLGPASTVADITHDGTQEVIAGNTAYRHDGQVLWTYDYQSAHSGCQGSLPCDGYTAVGDIFDDPHPEVVIVRRGAVYVIDHEGNLVWEQPLPYDSCTRNGEPANESGPPTIADFNGDGEPEIGTAGADYYVIAKPGCDTDDWDQQGCEERGILWKTPNQDCSSRATASSVFDFYGDGRAEVVYADEVAFQIYDGTTGEIVFEDHRHESNTRIEMPIVADINNDQRANVLVPSAYRNRAPGEPGLWAWGDPEDDWVRSRRIWNQHAYSITNIEEDGTVPANPDRNWEQSRFNNFRQNVEPAGLYDAPNLAVRNLEATNTHIQCATDGYLNVYFEVHNEGAVGVDADLPVDVELSVDNSEAEQIRVHTDGPLLPGHHEEFTVKFDLSASDFGNSLKLRVVADSDDEHRECQTDNNEATLATFCDVPG